MATDQIHLSDLGAMYSTLQLQSQTLRFGNYDYNLPYDFLRMSADIQSLVKLTPKRTKGVVALQPNSSHMKFN